MKLHARRKKMMTNQKFPIKKRQHLLLLFISMIVISHVSTACNPTAAGLESVDYTPLSSDDWEVSTPAEQGLDPKLIAKMYYNASELETLYELLVIKDDKLVAEDYFNAGSVTQIGNRQSVANSYPSALVGIALDQGCLDSVDQKMPDFFPDYAGQIKDARKKQITIRHLLQMRTGYPWEESDLVLWDALWSGNYLPLFIQFPLVSDPGTEMHYSNLTSDWLGMIVARACGTDLKSFAQEHLFTPIGAEVGTWTQDRDGYYIGHGEIQFTARDMAKFGLLYLNEGEFDENQIIFEDWVHDSLQTYSEDAWDYRVGRNFKDIGMAISGGPLGRVTIISIWLGDMEDN